MCRVDVVMATYNGEKYLSEQVHSVLNNKGCEVYLHVFDDGSTDQTMEILQELKQQYSRHLTIHQNEHNLGVTKNFLVGIRKVMELNHEANYFMCCDQDDVWNQDKIIKTLKRMKQMEKRFGADRPLLVFTDAMIADEHLNEIEHSFYKSQHLQVNKTDLAHLLMENKCIGCTTMINRSFEPYLWEIPNHARFHDWWLALIASTFGNISFLPRQTLRYRQHQKNVVGGVKFGDYLKNRLNSFGGQRKSLHENKVQAEEFYHIFEDAISSHKKRIVEEFISMYQKNWYEKRCILWKNGYLKSGLIRNIGLFIIF